jgi:ribose transport system substrate-binding protein
MRLDRYPASGTAVTVEEKHLMKKHRTAGLLAAIGAIVVVVGACSAAPGASPAASGGGGSYKIGFSNPGGVGNGWREAMICSAKVQAAKSGQVTEVSVTHRDTDAAGQLADIRDLIAKGVNAIVINPASPDALNPALAEAEAAGIVIVSVDAPVTAPNAYNLSNNQEEYAYLGASWLFEQLGGEGKVVYMRGIAGHQADTDRDTGFQRALDENPGIEVVAETQTDWDPATGVTQINEILSSGEEFDGIWTSGIDSSIVDALKTAGADWVPVVGADNAGFVQQLLEEEGLEGAAVTNPPAVGGAGVELALRILNGDVPDDKNVLVSPELWENVTEEGKAQLTEAADPDIDPLWPLGLTVEGWTDYSKEEIIACKGPGES